LSEQSEQLGVFIGDIMTDRCYALVTIVRLEHVGSSVGHFLGDG
jgi:hypothetical protein